MSYVIEGTLTEVQQQLSALSLPPESHMRVIIDEPILPDTSSREAFLATAERKNGIILSRLEYQGKPLTMDVVKELQEDELCESTCPMSMS